MDAEKEKRFRFQMQFEQEQAQTQQSQPYQPTLIEEMADVSSRAQEAVMGPLAKGGEKIARGLSEVVFKTDKPIDYLQKGLGAIGEGIQSAEGATAEYLGKQGVNPYLAAAIPIVAENAASMLIPSKAIKGSILKPTIPAERQAAVRAAEESGVQLLRGEKTGSRLMQGLENFTEKTSLGSKPMNAFRAEGDAQLQAMKTKIAPDAKEVYDVGAAAKEGMSKRSAAMKATKNEMFEKVPDNVTIPLKQSKSMADTLLDEQSKLYGGTQSPEVLRWSKIVNDAELSTGKGVTGGPDVSGITRQTTSGPEYGVKHSVGPEQAFPDKSNYFALKKLRENLGEAIGQAKAAGKYQDFRDLTRLKASLDTDINDFVKNQDTPLGQMVGKEFSETYRKANAFSGAYKRMFESDAADLIENTPPEKILSKVFQKNNETQIKKFRSIVGDEAFQEAKKKWISDLVDSNNLSNEISKFNQGTIDAILTKPEQLQLQKLGDIQGIRNQRLQGTEGSARSNIHKGQYTGLGAGLLAGMTGNVPAAIAGIGQFVAPYPIAKALTSNAVREGIDFAIPGAVRNAAYASFINRVTTRENAQ